MNSETAGPDTDFDKGFTAARLALLIGVLMAISYPDVLFGSHAFFYRDTGQFGYPVAYYLRNCFWRGEVPLWNPYNNCGIPFLAQWNTLALYPPSLFYILLPMPWAMNFFILGHVFLAGIGMYFLSLRWFGSRFGASVAGMVFAWNGLAINCWMWPCHIAALGWMPWVVLLCELARGGSLRAVILAAMAGAFQMVTGSPEIIIFTWLMVGGGCLLDRGRGLGRLAVVVVSVTALSAAQLFPWLDLLAHGDRTTAAGDNAWAMPAWGLANFFVPLFRMTGSITGVFMQQEQQWTSSYFLGVVAILLAMIAVLKSRNGRTLFLAVVAVGGVLCAMGDSGGVLKVLKSVAPAFGLTRYPIKFVVLTLFATALLAGSGVAWVFGCGRPEGGIRADAAARRPYLRRLLLSLGRGIGIVVAVIAFCIPMTEDSRSVVGMNGLVRLLFLGVAMVLMLLPARRILGFALLLVMGLDVCTHEPRQNPTVPIAAYGKSMPQMSIVPRLGESRAMLGPEVETLMSGLVNSDPGVLYAGQRAVLYSDCNLLEEIPKVNGFFSIHIPGEAAVGKLLYSGKSSRGLAEFLGLSQISKQLFTWEAQSNFMAWATIGQEPVFKEDAAVLAAMGAADFEPRRVVYLPPELRAGVSAYPDAKAAILTSRFAAEKCSFETQAATRTMMVVAQAYYHDWKASVDGVEVPLLRANVGFQAVEVPAGKHTINIIYKDRAFEIGAGISCATLVFCVGGLVGGRRR